jgi:hypothetical protein
MATFCRRHALLALVILVLAPLYLLWSHNDQIGEVGSDATDYLIMAQSYAPGHRVDAAVAQAAAVSRFPPLYPLTLAWTGSAFDLLRAHAVTTAFLLAALVVLYAWLVDEGLSPAQGALLGLAFAALPVTWLTGLLIHSEYLYLLTSLLAIALLCRCSRQPRDELLYAAALTVAVAALTRTVGVALYAPLGIAALRSRRRSGLLAMVVAVAPVLLWHFLHQSRHSYSTALEMYYGGGNSQRLLDQLAQQGAALYRAWHGLVAPWLSRFAAGVAVVDVYGALCVAAVVWRAARLRADALYLLPYLGILVIWPYPEVMDRLLWSVLPLLLVQPLLLLHGVSPETKRASMAAGALALVSAALLLQSVPEIGRCATLFRDAPYSAVPGVRGLEGWYSADRAHAMDRVSAQVGLIASLRTIAERVPQGDCVIATRTDLVTYYARRPAAFPPLASVPDPYFMRLLRAPGCRYVFMYSSGDGHFPVPLHPLQRIRGVAHVLGYWNFRAPRPGAGNFVCILARID